MKKKYNRIANFSTNGIKSFKKKVEIDLLTNPKSENFPHEGNVKAFYGENGSGKTAIIQSFDILFKLMSDENYLSNAYNQKILSELLNKESNKIVLSVSFLVYQFDNEEIQYEVDTYRFVDYSVSLTTNRFGQFYFSEQSLEVFKDSDIKKSKKPLYKFVSKEEQVVHDETSSLLNAKLQNQLLTKSFTSLLNSVASTALINILKSTGGIANDSTPLVELIKTKMNLDQENAQKFEQELLVSIRLSNFLSDVNVIVGNDDEIKTNSNSSFIASTNFISIDPNSLFISELVNMTNLDDRIQFENLVRSDVHLNDIESSTFTIPRESKDKFERDINYRTEIIKLFKPNILDVVPYYTDISEKNKFIIANIGFDYGDYVVPLHLESSGTKKLFEFADSIKDIFNGGIVIIDELDSGLHDIILSKLVEFVAENCIGQLIFTTHNLAPMEVLESKKGSIDFINSEQEIVKWNKRGNSKAVNFYRSGKVKGIPHNLSSDDFLRLIGKDK